MIRERERVVTDQAYQLAGPLKCGGGIRRRYGRESVETKGWGMLGVPGTLVRSPATILGRETALKSALHKSMSAKAPGAGERGERMDNDGAKQ